MSREYMANSQSCYEIQFHSLVGKRRSMRSEMMFGNSFVKTVSFNIRHKLIQFSSMQWDISLLKNAPQNK